MFGESTSESPRQPSPWDSRLLTPTGDKTPAINATAGGGCQHHSLIPEEDLSGHIEYKLRLPAHPSIDRLARLTSQLKWRLLEGGGEAIYELGVCDNGLLLGMSVEEIDASINTLHRMADGLGATVKIVRRMQVSAEGVKEVPIDQVPPIQHRPLLFTMPDTELRISRPPAYINKRRLTKKDRRTLKREREHWLEYQKLDSPNVEANAGTSLTSDDEKSPASGTALPPSWTSTPSYTSTTPPANEIPGLSHSPSPPSSTSSSHQCITQTTASISIPERDQSQSPLSSSAVSMHIGSSTSTGGSRTPDKPLPIEFSETEQAQYALRRRIRKEWKREKQHQKELERSRHLSNSHYSRKTKSSHGLPTNKLTPYDKYLDGLAALFGDIALVETDAPASVVQASGITACIQIGGEIDLGNSYASNKESISGRKRSGSAFSPTSSPLSGVLTPAVAITMASASKSRIQPTGIDLSHRKHNPSARRVKPTLPTSSAEEGRYAVECIINMPAALASQEHTDDESALGRNAEASVNTHDESFRPKHSCQEVSGDQVGRVLDKPALHVTCQKHKVSRTARSARERNQLQSFIDFETVWDELEMDI